MNLFLTIFHSLIKSDIISDSKMNPFAEQDLKEFKFLSKKFSGNKALTKMRWFLVRYRISKF